MRADRRTRLIRWGGRAAAVLGVTAVVAAAVAAGTLVAWPSHRVEPESVVVSPAESRQQRVCPGPLLELGDDATAATATSSIGSPDLVTGTFPSGVPVDEVPLEAPDNPSADFDGSPVVLEVEPDAVDIGLMAGAQSQEATTETTAGLAVAACAEPTAEAWLVGGSTALGRSTLVLLANPTDVIATVDLRIHSEVGPIEAPSALGIVVPARSQRVISLAGLAPDVTAPVVQVTSSGGRVAAALEQTAVDGLVPAGVELIAPAATPDDEAVIPGFVVTEPSDALVDPDHVEGDDFPAVRLLAPGVDEVEASVSVVPEGGGAGSTADVTLIGGQVVDVPFTELGPGAYTVEIIADGPVVAAARSSFAPGAEETEAGDFAWFPAATPLIGDAVVATPDAGAPVLHLAAGGEPGDTVEVTLEGVGAPRVVEVPAEGGTSVTLEPGDAVVLRDAEGVRASVSFTGARVIASMTVEPPGPVDAPITVYAY